MATTRIARPLERPSRAPQWWRGIVGLALLAIAFVLFSARSGIDALPQWLAPALVFAVGLVLVWSPLDSAVASDARRPDVTELFAGDARLRLIVGSVAVGWSVWWFASWQFTDDASTRAVVVPLALVAGALLLFAPWWLRLLRQVTVERERRVREYERAEMAAHLHDSVLQTLAMIQRQADDPKAVQQLARRQERELRNWLYGDELPEATLKAALASAAAEVEDERGVPVELVTVGDCDTSESIQALVRAAREAMVNAAKHSGADKIDVYAEVDEDYVEVFVRDRGNGFDADTVAEDRMGVKGSIVDRMARHGGTATIRSAPGDGTEVRLEIKR